MDPFRKPFSYVKKQKFPLEKSNVSSYNKHMFEIQANKTIQEKLHILADAAKYDVACTSSGVIEKERKECSEMHDPAESVTALHQTGAVSLCSRF